MKNQDYIRKYELGTFGEIGERPIDKNVDDLIMDLYFDYKSNLEYLLGEKEELSINQYDNIYAQMLQKVNSLGKKTPYDLPIKVYESLEKFYIILLKNFCTTVYNKIEEVKTWKYREEWYVDNKFNQFFSDYKFRPYSYNKSDVTKFPKIVKIVYDIYLEKKKEYEQLEREREQRKWERERKQYQNRQNTYNSFWEQFFGNAFNDFMNGLLSKISIPTNEFALLGLTNSATVEDVKKQYRTLIMTHHPDKGGSQEKFIEITEAKNKCLTYLGV